MSSTSLLVFEEFMTLTYDPFPLTKRPRFVICSFNSSRCLGAEDVFNDNDEWLISVIINGLVIYLLADGSWVMSKRC